MTDNRKQRKPDGVVPLRKLARNQPDEKHFRGGSSADEQDDRDAAIISAIIGAAREWH